MGWGLRLRSCIYHHQVVSCTEIGDTRSQASSVKELAGRGGEWEEVPSTVSGFVIRILSGFGSLYLPLSSILPSLSFSFSLRSPHKHFILSSTLLWNPEFLIPTQGDTPGGSRPHSEAATQEQRPPGLCTYHTHPALTDIPAAAQRSWLCLLGFIPLGWNQRGLSWPGWGELCWTQGRAGQRWARQDRRWVSDLVSNGAGALGVGGDSGPVILRLLSLNHPALTLHPHSPHQPSPSPRWPDVRYSFQPQPKHTGLPPLTSGSRNPHFPRSFRGGASVFVPRPEAPGRGMQVLSSLTLQVGLRLLSSKELRKLGLLTPKWVPRGRFSGLVTSTLCPLSKQIGFHLCKSAKVPILAQTGCSFMVWAFLMGVHIKALSGYLSCGWPCAGCRWQEKNQPGL